jgi:hypothetical protein
MGLVLPAGAVVISRSDPIMTHYFAELCGSVELLACPGSHVPGCRVSIAAPRLPRRAPRLQRSGFPVARVSGTRRAEVPCFNERYPDTWW